MVKINKLDQKNIYADKKTNIVFKRKNNFDLIY